MAPPNTVSSCEIKLGSVRAVEAATALTREHYDEVCTNKALMVLDPDWARFAELEDAGQLVTLLVFDGDELAGYSVNLVVDKHLHYQGLAYLSNDIFFVREASRRGGIGKRLVRETERVSRELGLRACAWHAKEGSTFERLLRSMGYPVQDIFLLKEL